jgi:hypothetical protein
VAALPLFAPAGQHRGCLLPCSHSMRVHCCEMMLGSPPENVAARGTGFCGCDVYSDSNRTGASLQVWGPGQGESPALADTTPLLSGRFLAFMSSVTFRNPLATASPWWRAYKH